MPSCARGAADLGRGVLVHLAAGLGRVPVVAGAVGVERAEQALGPDRLGHPLEARHGALFGDEEGRVDIAGRIVHGDDQVPPSTGDPLVARAVLVQHHAGQGTARPACAGAAPRLGAARLRPWACKLSPQPVVAALEAVIGHQLLVEVLGREVPVAGVEQLQHPRHLVHRRAPRREAAQAAVVETVGSLRLVAVAPAPEGALRDTQNLRRLRLAQATPMGAPRKPPRTSSISVPVPAPSDASPPSMAWRRSKTGQIIWYINRTYRVLPTLRDYHLDIRYGPCTVAVAPATGCVLNAQENQELAWQIFGRADNCSARFCSSRRLFDWFDGRSLAGSQDHV